MPSISRLSRPDKPGKQKDKDESQSIFSRFPPSLRGKRFCFFGGFFFALQRMQLYTSIIALVALLSSPSTLAAPTIEERAATQCGSNSYSASQVNQAAQKACSLYQDRDTIDGYPETYQNYEGFDFPISGPYLEYPMLTRGVYDGGSPGADRVVINHSCDLAGEITHTGAEGNDFVGCSGTR
ncbi:Ribonuclease/ribotoxin [Xylaria sp. CBS 124048]|nr:Ribonuclease/ribotoxin [Xylaria sp. CBS 124048]